MPIVNSMILWSLPQVDGSFNVREQLTDDQGNNYTSDYAAPPGMDQQAHLAATVAAWEAANGGS
jgi:hypothetical protein